MTTGFIAYNANQQVLISSETKNLHMVKKLTDAPTTIKSVNTHGGLRIFRYTFTCPTFPVPFFTMPVSAYYGILGLKQTGSTTWQLEIARSGAGTAFPEVYIFSDPSGIQSTESHGMQVFMDDGAVSFDSRKSPLVVTGGTNVTHPYGVGQSAAALSAQYCSSSSSAKFTPTNYREHNVPTQPLKPMFHYSSLPQAEREASYSEKERKCKGFDYGVCIGYTTTEIWKSTYWAFYRGGIKLVRNSTYDTIQAGWMTMLAGCNWSTFKSSGFLFIDFGDDDGTGGTWPYTNETINLSATGVIMGDASDYD